MAIEVINDRPVLMAPTVGGKTTSGNPWYRSVKGAVIIEGKKTKRLFWRQPNAKYRLFAQIADEAILLESQTPNFRALLDVIPYTVFVKSYSVLKDQGMPHGEYPGARTYRSRTGGNGPTMGQCIVTQIKKKQRKCPTATPNASPESTQLKQGSLWPEGLFAPAHRPHPDSLPIPE